MTRRCSHCSNNGHNSRTCPTRGGGVRLFGVRLTDGSIMKKSASMGNLSALYHSSSPAAVSPNPGSPAASDPIEGYLSDDPTHASCSAKRRADRKKGTPWTEEEHRLFLLGLQKLGKGDWRGIARNYVLSRTPTQVASHAQKHFIRQCSATRRKRRSSLFDMAPDNAADPPDDQFMLPPPGSDTADHAETSNCSLKLSLKQESDQSMDSEMKEEVKEESSTSLSGSVSGSGSGSELPPIIPAFYPAYIPVPFQVWQSTMAPVEEAENRGEGEGEGEAEEGGSQTHHRVLKPIPISVHKKEALNLDELVGMSSQLTLKDTTDQHQHRHMEPSSLSLKLLAEPSRQSAFHSSSGMNKRDGDASRAI